MDTRNPNNRGAISIQMLVIMVPVLFGIMGFGLDLGRLYLVRGELNQAANSMALSAAAKLIGTSAALDDATASARLTLENSAGHGNTYNFGSLVIGETTGSLTSEVLDPVYYASVVDAIGEDSSAIGGSEADGATAKHVRVNITADAPLLFWGLLSLGQQRRTPIAAKAVAGISAPLCTACAIQPIAIAAVSADDTTDFGFIAASRYTFGFQCTGAPAPAALAGTTQRLPYLVLNHFDETLALDENQQLYRIGAQGLLPSTNSAAACSTIAATELVWTTATTQACSVNRVPTVVTSMLCGIYSRMDATAPAACQAVPDIETLSSSYQPDRDLADLDDYTAYTGDARRVITVAIVDALNAGGEMTILGFRQFLVEATQNQVSNDPADVNGRFSALYVGNVVPLKQGRFDGGCGVTSGPGKVVLHE